MIKEVKNGNNLHERHTMKRLITIAALLLSMPSFAFDPYDIRKTKEPDFSGTIDMPLQLAVRNVRMALLKCNDTKKAVSLKQMIFVDSIYPELKEAEIIGYTSTVGTALFTVAETDLTAYLLYVFKVQDDGLLKIETWTPPLGLLKIKPTTLERLSKPVVSIATKGAEIECDALITEVNEINNTKK